MYIIYNKLQSCILTNCNLLPSATRNRDDNEELCPGKHLVCLFVGLFEEKTFVKESVIVCLSVRLGLAMVKFSYFLVRHHEMAVFAVK